MAKYKKSIFFFVLILLIAGAGYLFRGRLFPPSAKSERQPPLSEAAAGEYESEAFSFSFSYSSVHTVREESQSSVALVNKETGREEARLDVILESGDVEVPYEQFVLDESRALCEAAGANLSCREVKDLSSIVNKNGLSAQKFYLVLEEKLEDSVTSREKGPFYAFNFSENTPGKMSFILIHPPIASRGSVDLLSKIADSFAF
ncbi:hypothetical protein EPN83_01465 [Patescibacteria group bacterium]|nr:MAG: hypothetical protein EPN83_01465 [Patescibacteria group bacterium]